MVAPVDPFFNLIGAPVQKPITIVKINNTNLYNPVAVNVTFGVEQQSSTASVRLAAEDYPSWAIGSIMQIHLGFGGEGGGTVIVFEGDVEDIDTKIAPYFVELKAAGYLKRLQRVAGNTDPLAAAETPVKEWHNITDSNMWNELMQLGNVPRYTAGSGDSRTIQGPIKLMPGDNLRSKIDDIDHASESGQRTFEWGGQVYRTAALRVPVTQPAWMYVEGAPVYLGTDHPLWGLYSIDRQQNDRDVKNQAIVRGVQRDGEESAAVVGAVRQEESPYWGNDGVGNPIYVPFSFQSDLLETRDQCNAVAERYMYEHNKITDVVHLRTPLNPLAMPSRTVGLISRRLNLQTLTNYWVRQVSHHWGPDGATTDWTLEGGAAATGYLVGIRPVALFTMKVTREIWQDGIYDTPTMHYTAACDGSASYDQDHTLLTYAWTASNGSSGTGVGFTTMFTQAQIDDFEHPATVTLIVTDSDVPTHHVSEPNEQFVTDATSVDMIAMYVAALGICHATPDGWISTYSWTPPANALCCCRIVSDGTNYFGLANGAVYRTPDYLASAPILVWTGDAAVTAMWMSEIDPRIVAVGLANGKFYVTKDSFTTPPVLRRTFGGSITWINGSDQVMTQWRACVGSDVWYTDNDFIGAYVLRSFPGQTVTQNELTDFANYGCAKNGTALILRETGEPVPFPAGLSPAPTDISMTAFVDTDELLVVDDQGRSFISVPASLGTTMVQKAGVGQGAVHDVLRDNVNFASAYAACDTGLVKTFDKAETWHRVLAYNGTTTKAVMIGYDPAPPPLPVITGGLVEAVFQGSTQGGADTVNGGIPGGKDYPMGDDPTNKFAMDLWNPALPQDGTGARNAPPPTGWYLPGATLSDYVNAGFAHQWQPGETGIVPAWVSYPIADYSGDGSGRQYMDRAYGGWVRSQTRGNSGVSGYPSSVSPLVPPDAGFHPEWLCRHKFVLPTMLVQRAIFTWGGEFLEGSEYLLQYDPVDVTIEELWINGTLIGSNMHNFTGIELSPSLFTANDMAETLVCVRVRQRLVQDRSYFFYKLSFGAYPGSVALISNTTTGGLIWGSSAECAVEVYALTASGEPFRPLPSNWYVPVGLGPLPIGGAGSGFTGRYNPYLTTDVDHIGLYANPWPAYEEHGFKLANQLGHTLAMDPGASTVYKQAADFPVGPTTPWRLYVRKKYYDHLIIEDIYINGTRLSTGTPASPAGDAGNNRTTKGGDAAVYMWEVPAAAVTMGARNTIAFRTTLSGGYNLFWGLAWYLEQVMPDA